MNQQSYNYFDHDADIGVIGRGETIERAFEAVACAMFDIMIDRQAVNTSEEITLDFEEEDDEFALVIWLNLLLSHARTHHLALKKFHLEKQGNHWHAQVWGQPLSDELNLGTEVKGATLTMLSVKQINKQWQAQCIVDV